MIFRDRTQAGQLLAERLEPYRDSEAVIYALPRGGVVLGIEVVEALQKPLDLLIPRKISHPHNSEYAICAVTEDGSLFCNKDAELVDQEWLQAETRTQQEESKRRRETYLAGREPLPVEGKNAIIVDDGIATGLTMLAAIAQAKARRPEKIIVAIPVVPPGTLTMLKNYAEEVVALEVPAMYMGSVGAYYEEFEQVEDGEVIKLMGRSYKQKASQTAE